MQRRHELVLVLILPVLAACLLLVGRSEPSVALLGEPEAGGPEGFELRGLRLRLGRAPGLILDVEAASASRIEPRLGPFSLGAAVAGLRLIDVRARSGALRIRAEALELRFGAGQVLRFSGRVRCDDGGRGLLFAGGLVLDPVRATLRSDGPCVLGPTGTEGGYGGEAVSGFTGTLEELRARVAR